MAGIDCPAKMAGQALNSPVPQTPVNQSGFCTLNKFTDEIFNHPRKSTIGDSRIGFLEGS
jgi:hypothetical protein